MSSIGILIRAVNNCPISGSKHQKPHQAKPLIKNAEIDNIPFKKILSPLIIAISLNNIYFCIGWCINKKNNRK